MAPSLPSEALKASRNIVGLISGDSHVAKICSHREVWMSLTSISNIIKNSRKFFVSETRLSSNEFLKPTTRCQKPRACLGKKEQDVGINFFLFFSFTADPLKYQSVKNVAAQRQ